MITKITTFCLWPSVTINNICIITKIICDSGRQEYQADIANITNIFCIPL